MTHVGQGAMVATASAMPAATSAVKRGKPTGGVRKNGVVQVASGFGRSAAGSGRLSPLFPAQEIGGHLEENAPTVGQPPDAQAVTESAGKVARPLTVQRAMT